MKTIMIRVPDELHDLVQAWAKQEERPMSRLLLVLLRNAVDRWQEVRERERHINNLPEIGRTMGIPHDRR